MVLTSVSYTAGTADYWYGNANDISQVANKTISTRMTKAATNTQPFSIAGSDGTTRVKMLEGDSVKGIEISTTTTMTSGYLLSVPRIAAATTNLYMSNNVVFDSGKTLTVGSISDGSGTPLGRAMTEEVFRANQQARREEMGGSGFIEWGHHINSGAWANVNEGMWAASASPNTTSQINLGRAGSGELGDSLTRLPRINVNGTYIKLDQYGSQVVVALPAAPSTVTTLARQDWVGLEVWEELISDKDFVYPLGAVQYLGSTYDSIATVEGSFSGFGTYSIHGTWQTSEDLVGKGWVWSTLSDANKVTILSNPEHNVFLNSDGNLVQARYRIRVIKGRGDGEWYNPVFTYDYDVATTQKLAWSSTIIVKPKGKLTSVAEDLDLQTGGATGYYQSMGNTNIDVPQNRGKWAAVVAAGNALDTTLGYLGYCYIIPIALVSRRNDGAFDPVMNPSGAAEYSDDDPWYSTSDARTLAQAFTSQLNGDYASSVSGRPDGLYYDVAYAGDVQDLRYSAHKIEPSKAFIEQHFRKLVHDTMRGWDGERSMDAIMLNPTSSGTTSSINYTGISTLASVGDSVILSQGIGYWRHALITAVAANSLTILDDRGGTIKSTETTHEFIIPQTSDRYGDDLMSVDVIGFTTAYPTLWTTNSIMGYPLLVSEDGTTSLTPDGSTATWKLSRKNTAGKDAFIWDGSSWTQDTETFDTNANTVTLSANLPVTHVAIVFYASGANTLETADQAETLEFQDSFGTCWNDDGLGGKLALDLIGKVPVATAAGIAVDRKPLTAYGINALGKFYPSGTYATLPTHAAYALQVSTPAAKVLPYITSEYGVYYLHTIFKEMKYTSGAWQDDEKFQVTDDVSTTTDDDSNTVIYGQKRIRLPYFYIER